MLKWQWIIFGGRIAWRNLLLTPWWWLREWAANIRARYKMFADHDYVCMACGMPHNIITSMAGTRIGSGGIMCPECAEKERASRPTCQMAAEEEA